ncbi:hypothetical protein [Jiella mangrovi]|uniref:DUF697 domain-containing protein n=1 Tax=Jiella mangrovi TaxID=2821407 RepID=A0ABS4BDH5_9HYPH|nr:hypothetical protein [Jiella mangrovi]MBP0614788.1 hypothetical protein [Jiella mangrovi]
MAIEQLILEQMKNVYEQLNVESIKKDVDEKGIDAVINQAALWAGATGAVAGTGGAVTMVFGLPVSVINTLVQQFRVTMAVIHHKRQSVVPSFEDFMKIVGLLLGVQIGATMTRSLLLNIAGQIGARVATGGFAMAVPVLGGVVGGGANYLYIRGIGASLKRMNMKVIEGVERPTLEKEDHLPAT